MSRISGVAYAFAVVSMLPALAWGDTYAVELNTAAFGGVNQSDVPAADGPSGASSCAPTATADVLAFLQQESPEVYGTSLVGAGSYSAIQTTATLLASSAYMDTSSGSGTSAQSWVSGVVNYLNTAAAGQTVYGGMGDFAINTTTYPWFTTATPTFDFLYGALASNAGVELGMFPTSTGVGHVIALTGLTWNDANGNGIIDPSEKATMTYIDPEDGLPHTSAIWQLSAGGQIQTDYYQAGQDSGYFVLATTQNSVVPAAMVNNGALVISNYTVATQITGTGTLDVATSTMLRAGSIVQGGLTVEGSVNILAMPLAAGAMRNPNASTSILGGLTIAGGAIPTGTLNLNNNVLIIKNGGPDALQAVEADIGYARDGGAWDRPGITSTTAQASYAGSSFDALTLGAILNSDLPNGPYGTFGGQSVSPNDVLVMLTYGGDANLDGLINGNDYFAIDRGYLDHFGGWINGDFNYDGVVNGNDYFIIDSNYINQSGSLAAVEILEHAAMFGPSYLSAFSAGQLSAIGVPEPASLILLGIGATALLVRRRRV